MIDVERIVQMIEARRTACYKAAETDTTGYQHAMALEYDDLLSEIGVQRQNFETSMNPEE